jgi:hypothetical protein
MSKLLLASVLVLALSVSTLANDGIIQGGKAAPTPTPLTTTAVQLTGQTTVVKEGSIRTVVAEAATDLSLGLLRSLLALF